MKSSDVMIGDWVINDQEPTKVNYLTKDNIGVENAYFVEFSDVEPIPLTEEILKDNGFVFDGLIRSYKKFKISKSFFSFALFKKYIIEIGEIAYTIKYVHELQHALRLCGLNEMADNFKIE